MQVAIDESPLNMILRTPDCEAAAQCIGSLRPLNPQERQIYVLWDSHDLNATGFSGGQIVAFL
jgi:hypothetical protein